MLASIVSTPRTHKWHRYQHAGDRYRCCWWRLQYFDRHHASFSPGSVHRGPAVDLSKSHRVGSRCHGDKSLQGKRTTFFTFKHSDDSSVFDAYWCFYLPITLLITFYSLSTVSALFTPSCVSQKQPLLQWETLAPIVRAAALAHTQEVPPAIALLGTELAAAAINLVPSGDGNGHRIAGCDRQQGVLVLSAALRLVAQADVCSQGARRSNNEGGSYARWIRSCFGVASSGEEIVAAQDPAKPDVRQCQAGQGAQNAVSDQCWQESELHGSEVGGLLPLSRGRAERVFVAEVFTPTKHNYRHRVPVGTA